MSRQIHCQNCGRDFEKKENDLFCPYCHSLVRVEDVFLTSLSKGLQYVHQWQGVDTLKNGNRIQSILSDLMPNQKNEIRLVKAVYAAAGSEIGALIDRAGAAKAAPAEAQKAAAALFGAYISQKSTDAFLSALLEALSLDADTSLAGSGHPAVFRLRHKYDLTKMGTVLSKLDLRADLKVWRHGSDMAALFLSEAPRLTEKAELLKHIIDGADGKFRDLARAVFSGKTREERPLIAIIMKNLADSFMDDEDIRAGSEALFAVLNIRSASGFFTSSQPTWQPAQPPAKRAANANAKKQSTQPTKQSNQTAARRSASSQPAAGTQYGRSIQGASPIQQPTNTVSFWAKLFGGKGKGRRLTKKQIVLGLLAAWLLFVYLVLPGIRSLTSRLRAWQYQRQQQTVSEETREETTEEPSATQAPLTMAERYPAPEVSTSSVQSGLYQVGNIASPSQYRSYVGPDDAFSFRYPGVLYDDVSYSIDDDGKTIEISFTCQGDASSLFVECHPCPEAVTEELKQRMMSEAMAAMTDAQVLADRQAMSGMLSDTQSQYRYTYYLKGHDAQDPGAVRYELVRLSADGIMRMVLQYPEPVSEEDRAFKEYYAEVMYDLCGFGGDSDYPAWADFKKDYSF